MDLLLLTDFFRTFIASLKVDLPDGKEIGVFLNGERLNDEGESDVLLKSTDGKIGGDDLRIRVTDEFVASQVTTGGIPFVSLYQFLKNSSLLPQDLIRLIDSGFILDIAGDIYDPVVSRNRLQMEPEKLRELKRFLLDVCYIQGLELGKKDSNFLDINFLHFGSRIGKFNQIALSATDNKDVQDEIDRFLASDGKLDLRKGDFFTYYKLSDIGKSFFDKLDNCYKSLISDLEQKERDLSLQADSELFELENEGLKEIMDAENQDAKERRLDELIKEHKKVQDKYKDQWRNYRDAEFKKWKESLVKDKYGLVDSVVIPWFEKKMEDFRIRLRGFNVEGKEDLIPEKDKESFNALENRWLNDIRDDLRDKVGFVGSFLTDMASLYGSIFVDKTDVNKKNLDSINLFYSCGGPAGFYDGINIYLNLKDKARDFLLVAKDLLDYGSGGSVKTRAVENLFIPKKGYTPVVIHELEHARRNDLSEISFHNKCIIPSGEKVAFDICANEYAREAINNGILIDWKEQIPNIVEKNFGGGFYSGGYLFDQLISFLDQTIEEDQKKYAEEFLLKKVGI